MIAKLVYDDPPCGVDCCSRQYRLQVSNTERGVCLGFAAWLRRHLGQKDEDAQEVEIDARRLWEEIPSPCWMLWFLFNVAADVQDAGIIADVGQLRRSLDAAFDEGIDPAKCAAIRRALPWERVEALLVRAGGGSRPYGTCGGGSRPTLSASRP